MNKGMEKAEMSDPNFKVRPAFYFDGRYFFAWDLGSEIEGRQKKSVQITKVTEEVILTDI